MIKKRRIEGGREGGREEAGKEVSKEEREVARRERGGRDAG